MNRLLLVQTGYQLQWRTQITARVLETHTNVFLSVCVFVFVFLNVEQKKVRWWTENGGQDCMASAKESCNKDGVETHTIKS